MTWQWLALYLFVIIGQYIIHKRSKRNLVNQGNNLVDILNMRDKFERGSNEHEMYEELVKKNIDMWKEVR